MYSFYPSSCPTRGPADLHPLDCQVCDFLNALVDKLGVRDLVYICPKVLVVVIQHQSIHVDLRNSSSYAAFHQLWGEPVGAVQGQINSTIRLAANLFES